MGVLDPEYSEKVVSGASAFEEEVEKKKKKKEYDSTQIRKRAAVKKLEESAKPLKITEDKPKEDSSSNESAKGLIQGVKTSLDSGDPDKPPSPFMSALETGISSGGNPAAIGGALMMGMVKSMQYKEQMKKMGQARAQMEEAKGEQQKGQIALRMGDAISRAIGGAGRKRSINI